MVYKRTDSLLGALFKRLPEVRISFPPPVLPVLRGVAIITSASPAQRSQRWEPPPPPPPVPCLPFFPQLKKGRVRDR